MDGFKKFLLRGNVVDLAVAVVIGAAFAAVIGSVVDNFVTPLLGALGGTPDFSSKSFTINSSRFTYGLIINALIYFVSVAAIIYFFVVNPINKLMERYKPTPTEPTLPWAMPRSACCWRRWSRTSARCAPRAALRRAGVARRF